MSIRCGPLCSTSASSEKLMFNQEDPSNPSRDRDGFRLERLEKDTQSEEQCKLIHSVAKLKNLGKKLVAGYVVCIRSTISYISNTCMPTGCTCEGVQSMGVPPDHPRP